MKRLFLFLLALYCISCDNTLGPPKDVLSERKMVSLLADLQLAEAKVKQLRIQSDSARQLYHLYEMRILDKHNVSQQEYVHSYQYYLENHRLMTRVHDAVLDTLQRRQQKIERMPDTPEPPQQETVSVAAADSLHDSTEVRQLRQQSIKRREKQEQ